MKIMVGYNGGEVGKRALLLARDWAEQFNAFVYVITSMEGGASEKQSDIVKAQEGLDFAENIMKKKGIACDARQSVQGLSPGEDLVKFARTMEIDHIFLGVRKKSRAEKMILGSTARYVILKADCPVTTVNWDLKTIKPTELLREKWVLVVDDEPDILEIIEESLDMCTIDTAGSFEQAKVLLETNRYDVAILDIMGVNGYELLELANNKNIPALMLTAHALTPENLKASVEKGAAAYVPKNELAGIVTHVADVVRTGLGNGEKGRWFSRLKPTFDRAFGKGWRDRDRRFWNSFDDKYGM